MFSVDFENIATNLLPIAKRKVKRIALLRSILSPLQYLNTVFNTFRTNTHYSLRFNAQVIYLEHFLNDQYDPGDRGIYIEDNANIEYTYIFNKDEAVEPQYLFNSSEAEPPVYFYNRIDYDADFDYIVKVPVGVSFSEIEMRNKILRYNAAGRRFKIETYE